MNLQTDLSLSIVSHGHGSMVLTLLEGLDQIEALKGVAVFLTLNIPEVLPATGGFRRIELKVIRNDHPLGFGANHNNAFAHCNTPWFAILNPDLQIGSDVFTPLLHAALRAQAALVVPRIVNGRGKAEDSVRSNLTPWSLIQRATGGKIIEPPPERFRWFAGMFYMVHARSFAQVKGFDERIFLYCEDFDLCARMALNSKRLLFEPSVQVVHDAQRGSHRSWRLLRLHLRSLARVWTSPVVWRIAWRDARGIPTGV